MKSVFILLVLAIFSYAKSVDIYLLDKDKSKGRKKFLHVIKTNSSSKNDTIIIDCANGDIRYRGSYKDVVKSFKKYYIKKKNKNVSNFDVPFCLDSVYKTILPNQYENINIYFFNAVFYKNGSDSFDFNKGFPNDSFLLSKNSPFSSLHTFDGLPVISYIFVNKKYFINSDHKNGLKRFYYLLFDRLKLNLQVFNDTFNTKREIFDVTPVSGTANDPLKITLTPPRKIHYNEDHITFVHNPNDGTVSGYIRNRNRSNSKITVYLNNDAFTFDCDIKGKCDFKIPLRLGSNIIRIKKIDNTEYKKVIDSKYIPNDKIEYFLYTSNNRVALILKSVESHRPAESEVELVYEEKNKTFKTRVDENGYYEFRIPVEYINNNFILKEYNGNSTRIIAVNPILKRKAQEEAKRKAKEARQRALEEARKKALEEKLAKKRAEEERKRIKEERKKSGAINSGVNKVIGDEEVLINNYDAYSDTLPQYKLMLNSPMRIKELTLVEYDADDETFDILIEDLNGNIITLAREVTGSGNNKSKIHNFVNPNKNTPVKSVIIKTNGDLGGSWKIEKATVKYYRGL